MQFVVRRLAADAGYNIKEQIEAAVTKPILLGLRVCQTLSYHELCTVDRHDDESLSVIFRSETAAVMKMHVDMKLVQLSLPSLLVFLGLH